MKYLACLLCAAAIAASAVPSIGAPIASIAAVVNSDIITARELEKEAAFLIKEAEKKGTLDDATKAQIRTAALDKLIDKKLVEQKIKELDIRIGDEEIRQAIEDVKAQNNLSQEKLVAALASQGLTFEAYKIQLREQLERLRLVSQEVRSKIQVPEKEIREFYDQNRNKMTSNDLFRARHILLKLPAKATPEEVEKIRAKAESILKEAKAGADFAELARKHSDDASAGSGGDLGMLKRGDILPELDAIIARLQPGGISDVVATPAGFTILRLEEKVAGEAKSFEQMRDEIEELLYRKKSEERFNQWLDELRKSAAIEVRR